MNARNRLQIIVNELFKGSRRAFSSKIGVPPATIDNILGERASKPSLDIVEKIFNSIECINPAWLLSGMGNMFKTEESTDNISVLQTEESIIYKMYKEKDAEARELSEEVGKLKYENSSLKERLENLTVEITLIKKVSSGSQVVESAKTAAVR